MKKGQDRILPLLMASSSHRARRQLTISQPQNPRYTSPTQASLPAVIRPRLKPHHSSATASRVTSEETIMVLSSNQGVNSRQNALGMVP